jgi:predicted PurR-regulated permease PerM
MKKEKIMGTGRWLFYASLGVFLIIVYKFFDNFTGIGHWLSKLFGILTPFLVAILISYVLYVPCKKIEQHFKKKGHKHTRALSITIVYVLVALLIFLVCRFVIPSVITSIVDLVNNLQSYYNAITTNELEASWAPFLKDNVLKPIVEYVNKLDINSLFTVDKIKEYITSAVGVAKGVLNIFIAFICSIYILAEKESIVSFIKRLARSYFNDERYARFDRYFTEGNRIFLRFISSQVIDAFVVSIIMSIALSIMKVKYSALLGFMIGLFNLIPYFGAIAGVIIAVIITVFTGGWKQAIIMLIVVIILQQIDANIINPRITGSRLNVSPLLVIFAVTVGGAYFGVIGMFIAVPIATLIKLMLTDHINRKENEIKENEKV